MPATTSCTPCCSEPQVTNVPGIEGEAGADGTNGENAYTTTTAAFDVPAVGADVTVQVVNSAFMVPGQVIVTDGPATFRVDSVPDATSVILTFIDAGGDVAVGATIASGAGVAPGGAPGTNASLSVYAAGTAYQLTATPALLDFGTTDPTLVLTSPGTWLILARVRYDYTAATFAAVRDVTTKLRRTNNTAADLTNGSAAWKTEIITTLTYTAVVQQMPPVIYTTANSDDSISLWGSVSVVPTAGSLDAIEAEIVAIQLVPG